MNVCPTITTSLSGDAQQANWSTSDALVASGFSTKTCLPASSAALVIEKCVPAGVAMITAFTSGSRRTSSTDSTAFVFGKFASTKARRSGLPSATYLTVQLASAEKLRNRLGPQYPQPNWAKTKCFEFIFSRCWSLRKSSFSRENHQVDQAKSFGDHHAQTEHASFSA